MGDTTTPCKICGRTRAEHGDLVHEFSADGSLVKNESSNRSSERVPGSQKAPQATLKGDPVLRMVMVRKGLITPEELKEVEDELRATGAVFDVHSARGDGRDPEAGESGDP